MTNEYKIMKDRHQQEVNEFPIVFAFDMEQFEKGMRELGVTGDYKDEVVSVFGGGFIRKTDSDAFKGMFERHDAELQQAIDNDPTGDGFIFDMFYYELCNHEYGYTREIDQTLGALGLSIKDINNDDRLLYGLQKAMDRIKEEDE